ncbi:MAG: DMP19 family protein [Bacteroidaceae bacterium]|nr:DMP19 family protein [Bacteroidaceae bacterium]
MNYEESIEKLYNLTDEMIERVGGQLTDDVMDRLSLDEHCLLAYRYLRDEVMEGGWFQLIQNGFGPYILLGPLPMLMKKVWGLKYFGQYLFDVSREYKKNKEELERDKTDEEFMASYEQFETLNEMGDDFLDEWEEMVTPAIVMGYIERQKA